MFGLLAGACWPAVAQQGTPVVPTMPAASAGPSSDGADGFSPAGFLEGLKRIPFQWGPVAFHPSFSYQLLYGDGIQSRPGKPEKTIIQAFSANFLFNLGTHWTLTYSPVSTVYSSSQFHNAIGNSLTLSGTTSYNDWILGVSQSYSSSSAPLVETGTQTDQTSYLTAVNGSYQLSEAMSLALAVNQSFTSADKFNSSREWSTLDWLNYSILPGWSVGVGAGFGYVDVETGFDSTYQQLQGQTSFRATRKITLHANAGVEYRQLLNSGAGSLVNPLFGLSLSYRPFETTTLTIGANRGVGTSFFVNQLSETTSLQASLSQRLLKRLNLNVGYSYTTTRYVSSTKSLSITRRDEGSSYSVGLSCPIRTRTSVSVFYSLSENSSSDSAFQFTSSQVGLQIGYGF